jgi:hypothetical protein
MSGPDAVAGWVVTVARRSVCGWLTIKRSILDPLHQARADSARMYEA